MIGGEEFLRFVQHYRVDASKHQSLKTQIGQLVRIGDEIQSDYRRIGSGEFLDNLLQRLDLAFRGCLIGKCDVEKYEIEEVKTVGNQTHTKMKVWIGYTGLANRLLHESSTVGSINGQQAEAALTTAQEQFEQSDRLFATVLNDFPKRAFTVESEPPTVTYDSNRHGIINIPVKISWNYDYLLGLAQIAVSSAASTNEKLCYQSPGSCPFKSYIRIISGFPPWEVVGWTGWNETVAFNDVIKINMLANEMVVSRPALLVNIDGEPDYNQCHRWPELDHIDDYRTPTQRFVTFGPIQASINGDFTLKGIITVPVKSNHLFTMDQIKLEVVRDKSCPNRT
jgi:hypothetical protein